MAGPSALAPFTSPTAVKLHRFNQRPSALQMSELLLDLLGVAGAPDSLVPLSAVETSAGL